MNHHIRFPLDTATGPQAATHDSAAEIPCSPLSPRLTRFCTFPDRPTFTHFVTILTINVLYM